MSSHPEQRLQTLIAQYLSWCLKDAWFSAVPAGGGGEMRGKILKGMGYVAGCPDILIIAKGCAYFLEVKSKNGVLSEAQRRTHAALRLAGASVAVVRALDEVEIALGAWGIATRLKKPSGERITRALAADLAREGQVT